MGQLMIAVRVTTKMTANPIPEAVRRLFDRERNGHIPRRYVRAILCVRIAAPKTVSNDIAIFVASLSLIPCPRWFSISI